MWKKIEQIIAVTATDSTALTYQNQGVDRSTRLEYICIDLILFNEDSPKAGS